MGGAAGGRPTGAPAEEQAPGAPSRTRLFHPPPLAFPPEALCSPARGGGADRAEPTEIATSRPPRRPMDRGASVTVLPPGNQLPTPGLRRRVGGGVSGVTVCPCVPAAPRAGDWASPRRPRRSPRSPLCGVTGPCGAWRGRRPTAPLDFKVESARLERRVPGDAGPLPSSRAWTPLRTGGPGSPGRAGPSAPETPARLRGAGVRRGREVPGTAQACAVGRPGLKRRAGAVSEPRRDVVAVGTARSPAGPTAHPAGAPQRLRAEGAGAAQAPRRARTRPGGAHVERESGGWADARRFRTARVRKW